MNGQNDPGALDIELDVITTAFALSKGQSSLTIWGVSLQQIAQSSQLTGMPIDVYAGMAKGLPLANPAQQGLIVRGTCYPAFGNWIGTEQTLDIVINSPMTGTGSLLKPDSPHNPAPIVHNWQQGQPLATAIQNTLSTAFPLFTPKVSISPSLVLPYTDTGFYPTIEAYSGYIRDISQSILGKTNYPGVMIAPSGNDMIVTDGTQTTGSGSQIQFNDLIGQPTWLGFNVISVKTAMRGDLSVGKNIMLPQTQATVSASSAPQFRQGSGFQGSFFVNTCRHIGRFRQPSAESWVSVFNCASIPSGAAAGGQGGIGHA